jgi:hypothetical protein
MTTRRVQVFVEGGWYSARELGELLRTAITNAQADDDPTVSDTEKRVITAVVMDRLMATDSES